jgi:hypothetical protein
MNHGTFNNQDDVDSELYMRPSTTFRSCGRDCGNMEEAFGMIDITKAILQETDALATDGIPPQSFDFHWILYHY